jgi:hypothetical protein
MISTKEESEALLRTLKALIVFVVALSTAAVADQAPTFHGIKLGVSLGSQFQECPWNPPKKGEIPNSIISPYKDDKGNTIPCFHYYGFFTPAAYRQVEFGVELIEHFKFLKDAEGKYVPTEPLHGIPTVNIELLVPASGLLRDGTIEKVILAYHPLESDRVRDALIKKFGASHPPPGIKVDPKFEEYMGITNQSII